MRAGVLKILTIAIALFAQFANSKSADFDTCIYISNKIYSAFNSNNLDDMSQYFNAEFKLSQTNCNIENLANVFKNLGDSILDCKNSNTIKYNDKIVLDFSIQYKKRGLQKSTITFDSLNRILSLELFDFPIKLIDLNKLEVKTDINKWFIIPFKKYQNLILVKAKINGKEENFIFDSGSPITILNSKYFSAEDSVVSISTKLVSLSGDISNTKAAFVNDFDCHGIKLHYQYLTASDLSNFESGSSTKIFGIIGYDFFKNFDISYNYKNKYIALISPDYFEEYKNKFLFKTKIYSSKFEQSAHLPIVKINIGNKELNLGVDCGASNNLLDISLFNELQHQNILKKIINTEVMGANQKTSISKDAILKLIAIDSLKFTNQNFIFSDLSQINSKSKVKLDGLIGFNILSKQETIILYSKRELLFVK